MRLILINPNTNAETTARMVAIARAAAPPGVQIDGLTAPFGVPLITGPAALAVAADAVQAAVGSTDLGGIDGIVVAAFGDPGLERLRLDPQCPPVTGIAEAGLADAACHGRRFAVVTTTSDLVGSIAGLVARYGYRAQFIGTFLTTGDVDVVMGNPDRLADALTDAARQAITAGAEAVVVGGGPLAMAARVMRPRLSVPVIEPIPAAVRLAIQRGASGDA